MLFRSLKSPREKGGQPPTPPLWDRRASATASPVSGVPGPGEIASTSASLQVEHRGELASLFMGIGWLSPVSATWARVLGLGDVERSKGRQVEGQAHCSHCWGPVIV